MNFRSMNGIIALLLIFTVGIHIYSCNFGVWQGMINDIADNKSKYLQSASFMKTLLKDRGETTLELDASGESSFLRFKITSSQSDHNDSIEVTFSHFILPFDKKYSGQFEPSTIQLLRNQEAEHTFQWALHNRSWEKKMDDDEWVFADLTLPWLFKSTWNVLKKRPEFGDDVHLLLSDTGEGMQYIFKDESGNGEYKLIQVIDTSRIRPNHHHHVVSDGARGYMDGQQTGAAGNDASASGWDSHDNEDEDDYSYAYSFLPPTSSNNPNVSSDGPSYPRNNENVYSDEPVKRL